MGRLFVPGTGLALRRLPAVLREWFEPACGLRAGSNDEARALAGVFLGDNLRLLVSEGHDVAAVVRYEDGERDRLARRLLRNALSQRVDAFAGECGAHDRVRVAGHQRRARVRIHGVGLVEDQQRRAARLDLAQDLLHGCDLVERLRVCAVHDVHEQVGLAHLVERRFEGLDQ